MRLVSCLSFVATFAAMTVSSGVVRADDCALCSGEPSKSIQDNMTVSLGGNSLDASYFTDADDLKAPAGLDGKGVSPKLPAAKAGFCSRNESDIAGALTDSSDAKGKLAFTNPDGLWKAVDKKLGTNIFGGGACWWDSRFQRSAAYLANYQPDKPKPTPAQARRLIDRLISMDSVVEIPGYANLNDFSRDYQDEISTAFNKWMLRDWLALHAAGEQPFDVSSEKPGVLQARMEAMYDRLLQKPQILFWRVHQDTVGAFDSHALLVTKMEPIHGSPVAGNPLAAYRVVGYQMKVIDSNDPANVNTINFYDGDPNMHYCDTWGDCSNLVPNIDWDSDLNKIDDAVAAYCRP